MSTSYAEPVLAWYARNARDLPWRAPGATPWAVLVSEIMLQQTPVARVLPEYLSWMARWPNPAALAASPAGEAIRQWGRLGYPRRALRLHETARRGEFATGLIYIEPDRDDFLTLLNVVDEPLATLPLERVRPPKEALDEIMEALR